MFPLIRPYETLIFEGECTWPTSANFSVNSAIFWSRSANCGHVFASLEVFVSSSVYKGVCYVYVQKKSLYLYIYIYIIWYYIACAFMKLYKLYKVWRHLCRSISCTSRNSKWVRSPRFRNEGIAIWQTLDKDTCHTRDSIVIPIPYFCRLWVLVGNLGKRDFRLQTYTIKCKPQELSNMQKHAILGVMWL